jgi:bifunctional oligoribonuclease and PAP phosphatase NrnA
LRRLDKLTELIEKVHAKKLLFLCHQNADPDAFCSAYVFSKVLKRLNPNLKIALAADGVSRITSKILDAISARVNENPSLNQFDLFILFDTNTFQQLGKLSEIASKNKPIVVFDHHIDNAGTKKMVSLKIVDEKARSTCELAFNSFDEMGLAISRKEALCLFLGMAYDTRHFALANADTFRIASRLMEIGVDPAKAIAMLISPVERSERMARLKAAQRAKVLSFKDWIIAFSRISSHQASSARALVAVGADMAVVGGEKEGALRISMRATEDFLEKTGLHLGRDLAQPLGEARGGAGGGHGGAAGINGGKGLDLFFTECEKILAKKLNG